MVLRAGGVNLPGVGIGPTTIAETPTQVLCLTELITADELMDNGEYKEILEDIREEGEKFGVLVNVIIPRPLPNGGEQVPGVGKHFQKMLSSDSAVIAETGDSWFNCQKLKLPEECGCNMDQLAGL